MGSGLLRDIEAVLFDLDGTLVHLNLDFGRMRAGVEALMLQYGLSMEGRSALYVLELIEDAVQELKTKDEEKARAFRQEAEAAIVAIELEAAAQVRVYPEVPELLRRLRDRGIKVAIITRNCRAAVERILAETPLACDVLLTRDEVTAVKPNPEHLLTALRVLDVKPQQALMVGDHPLDIEVGRAVGARTAAVLTGAGTPERFSEVQPDVILTQVGDLGEYLTDLKVIVFTCNWNAWSGLETAGYQRLPLPAGVRPIQVMCLGRLHSGLVLKAFELGADGVLMLGCPPGECHYEFGNWRAGELFEETRALARLLGIGEERLQLGWVAAGDGRAFAEKVQEFVQGVAGSRSWLMR